MFLFEWLSHRYPPTNGHDAYIDAIYLDSNIYKALEWIENNLIKWIYENKGS